MTEAKYEELISTLTNAGVALRDVNGEYRSTYEIFSDLAAKWDSLSSMTQSALATNIAGNRMQNVFYSLINQFKEAQGAMEAMGNSAGTLDQSFGKYLDTIVGHTEKLSAAFGSFSQTILNSSTAKTLIDIASGLVTVLETLSKIHMLLPLIIASVTIWRGLKSVQSVSQLSSNLILHKTVTEQDIAAVNGLTSAEQMLLSQQIALAVESGILSEEQGEQLLIQLGLNGATSAGIGATNGLSVSLRGLWTVIKSNPLGLILTVVTLIISAFQILSDKAEQARQETIQANQDIINSNREALDKYNTFATNANIIEKYLNATQLTTEQETKLQTAVDDVSKALGGKKIALSNTKQEQQEYLSLLQETAKEEKDAAVREARKSAQAARDTFKMKATESTSWTGTFLKSDVQDPKAIGEVFFNDAQDEISKLWRNAYDTGLVKTVSAQGDMATGFSIADDKRDDIDALLEYYELLLKIQNIYVDNKDTESDSYAAVTTAISQMKDAANDAYESMARLALLENPPDESIGSYDEYKQYVDDLLATSSQFADKSPEFIDAVRQQMYALGSEYPDAVQNANDAIETTTTTLAELKTKLSDISKEIDNIQSAYDTVKDLIDDYSENGYLSLDNLQSLLELEPEYLNLLIDENGQLNLNAQSYEDLAKAKLEDLLLSQIKATYAQILEMGVEEAAAYAAAQAYDTETSSLYALIEAQTQEALLQASIKDKDNNTTAYTDAVKRYTNTIPTLVGLVENYSFAAENATSETDSLTDALNDQKDALEDEKAALEDAKDALEEYKDELTDAQDKIQNLIDLVVDYLKKQKEAERDVLEERKEAFDDLIEKEKEELATKKEAAEFEEKLKSKQNAVAKDALAASIAGLDDSSAGKKAKKEADDALIESRADLYSTLADHEYDLRVNALDAIKEKQDEYYDAEIQKIDDYLDNERQIYEDACREIENDTGDLYDRLWDYTYRYTTKTRAEFDYLWTSAQEAIERYGGAQVGVINIMEYLQGEIYSTERQIANLDGAIDTLDTKISNVSDEIDRLGNSSIQNLTDQINNLKTTLNGLGSNKWIFRWKDVYGNDQTKYSALEDQTSAIHDILNQLGWDSRGGSFVKQHMEHLAVGTHSARGGLTEVNEQGHEIRVLNKGDGILTAKITRNLSNLGSDPVSFLADAGKKLLSKIGNLGLFGKPVTNPTTTYAVSNGGDMPITITNQINGDVNPSTLKALEKAQKDITQNAINGMMKMTLGLRNSSRVR